MTALILATLLAGAELEHAAVTCARACVAETGWRDHEACAAQVHVFRKRAERFGWTVADMATQYSTPLRTGRRPWVQRLEDDASPPRDWPERLSWRVHRPFFASLVDVARRALTGGPDPCPAAIHFGSCRLDGVPVGHVRAACLPGHAQCFYERVR